MKIKLVSLLIILTMIPVVTSFAFAEGRTTIYRNFDPTKKSIALVQDLADGSQPFYEACLTQALIRNGYTVMERVRLSSIFRELGLDYSGAVAEKKEELRNKQSKDETKADIKEDDITPSIIKKLCNLYGVKYLGFFGRYYNKGAYLRLIDAETSAIAATAVYYDSSGPRTELFQFDMEVVNIIVESLESAVKIKDPRVSHAVVLTKISNSIARKEDNIRIISQRKIADMYYITYVFTDEAPLY